jgi:complement component 1 Q subcomponent-binding protein, mitochondrial
MELRKTVGETEVTVCFQSRSPQPYDDQEQEPGSELEERNALQTQEGEEGDMQGEQDYCDFTVYVRKVGEERGMYFECASVNSEINISYCQLTNNVEEHKKINRIERGVTGYNGPEFESIDERLHTSFMELLRSFGINEELAIFIEHVSLDKEQRLYMKWLQDMRDYVSGL